MCINFTLNCTLNAQVPIITKLFTDYCAYGKVYLKGFFVSSAREMRFFPMNCIKPLNLLWIKYIDRSAKIAFSSTIVSLNPFLYVWGKAKKKC